MLSLVPPSLGCPLRLLYTAPLGHTVLVSHYYSASIAACKATYRRHFVHQLTFRAKNARFSQYYIVQVSLFLHMRKVQAQHFNTNEDLTTKLIMLQGQNYI